MRGAAATALFAAPPHAKHGAFNFTIIASSAWLADMLRLVWQWMAQRVDNASLAGADRDSSLL
jgi:hypothetical protein